MQTINATLFAAAASLNAFWVLNIAKEAYPAVKEFLNFYPVTGPLLGLYAASIVIFCLVYVLARKMSLGAALYYFMLSCLLFALAVFPPLYEPIVELLAR